jgi:DNA repair protein RadA/Sms
MPEISPDPVVTLVEGHWHAAWEDGYTIMVHSYDAPRAGIYRAELEVRYREVYLNTLTVDLLSSEEFSIAMGSRNGVAPVVWDSRLGNLYRGLRAQQASTPAGARRVVTQTAHDTVEETVTYAWQPYLPRKMVSLIDGDPGVGKTMFGCQLAANVSKGHPMPDQTGKPTIPTGPPAHVLMVAMEDHLGSVVKPRLRACGADLTKVTFVLGCAEQNEEPQPFTLDDLPLLTDYMQETRPGLVYIDAIQAVLGPKMDINRANIVTAVLGALKGLAEHYDCAVVCNRHPAKPGQNVAKLLYRGMGSQAFVGTSRSALFVEEHPGDPTQSLLIHYKCNTGHPGRTQIFSKARGTFTWVRASRITHALLAGSASGPAPLERVKACLWLEEYLKPGEGTLASTIYDDVERLDLDYSKKVLRLAADALGVQKRAVAGDFLWYLPSLLLEREKRERIEESGESWGTGGTGGTGSQSEKIDVSGAPHSVEGCESHDHHDHHDHHVHHDHPVPPVLTRGSVDSEVNSGFHGNLSPLQDDNSAAAADPPRLPSFCEGCGRPACWLIRPDYYECAPCQYKWIPPHNVRNPQ